MSESGNQRVYVWITLLVVTAGAYVTFFTDLVFPPELEVYAEDLDTLRSDEEYPIPFIVFALSDRVQLSSLEVVKLESGGEDGPVVWSLEADPAAMEVDKFVYGSTISGMAPPDDAPPRERLERGQRYRLEVRSGRRKGSVEFGV
ncbi:MAG: hypothetical protein AAGA57_09895 [Planctomycetota bacterium]